MKKIQSYQLEILREEQDFYGKSEMDYALRRLERPKKYAPFVHVSITPEEAIEVLAMITRMRKTG